MRRYGSELFEEAKGDRELMGIYFRKITSSTRFDNVLKNKKVDRPPKGNRYQIFSDLMDASLREYMTLTGRDTNAANRLAEEKLGVARAALEIFSEMEGVVFETLDSDKLIGAIKVEDEFYEIRTVKHRDAGNPNSPLEMIDNPKFFIAELADLLSDKFKVSVIKNNIVTVYDGNENRISVKITKKKNPLF